MHGRRAHTQNPCHGGKSRVDDGRIKGLHEEADGNEPEKDVFIFFVPHGARDLSKLGQGHQGFRISPGLSHVLL